MVASGSPRHLLVSSRAHPPDPSARQKYHLSPCAKSRGQLCGTSSPATASITVTGLTATIAAGPFNQSGPGKTNTFATNTVTVTGGSGSYTYLWTDTNDGNGTWSSGGTASTYAPSVSGVFIGSSATYTCTVTDTVTGKKATSNGAAYSWQNTT